MDQLLKIRIAIWLLVLALWGTLVYQFMGDELPRTEARMQRLSNPFPKAPPAGHSQQPESPPPAEPAQTPGITPTELEPIPPTDGSFARAMPTTRLPAPWAGSGQLATAPPPGRFIRPLPPKLPATRAPAKPRRVEPALRRHEYAPPLEPATPSGFVKTESRHFYVFSEKDPATELFLATLESLHANLMLDLAAFSPWARNEKVSIFLFKSQESYRRVTGRPGWSGGASSVSKRKIYLYASDELMGILAHELCHIYFDGFFLGGKPNPLWLSEGMATLVQIERGLTAPNWLPENLDTLYRGGGFQLEDLLRIESTAGANDDNVRLWYTQSYSVVRFLIRAQWKSSFYRFCSHLRDGSPMKEALHRAYGMPFNRVKALEHAWRYDIETRRITSLRTHNP